jgi:hypothetical protein
MTTDLAHFANSSTVNTSFGVSLDVMKMFKAGFSWAAQSQYCFRVDFFSKSE